jgi:hypothetical protein
VLTNPHSGGECIPLLHRNGRRLLVRQHVPHLATATAKVSSPRTRAGGASG